MKYKLELITEDASELQPHINGPKLSLSLWDYDQWLRSEIKHNFELDEKVLAGLQIARDRLYDFCGEFIDI